jgi:hypothetical protein
VNDVLLAEFAVFFQFQLFLHRFFVFGGHVNRTSGFAIFANSDQFDSVSHFAHSCVEGAQKPALFKYLKVKAYLPLVQISRIEQTKGAFDCNILIIKRFLSVETERIALSVEANPDPPGKKCACEATASKGRLALLIAKLCRQKDSPRGLNMKFSHEPPSAHP